MTRLSSRSVVFIYNEQPCQQLFYGKYLLLNASFVSVLGKKKMIFNTKYSASVLCYLSLTEKCIFFFFMHSCRALWAVVRTVVFHPPGCPSPTLCEKCFLCASDSLGKISRSPHAERNRERERDNIL